MLQGIRWFIAGATLLLVSQGASFYFYLKAQRHTTAEAEQRWRRWGLVPTWAGREHYTPEGQRYWWLSLIWGIAPLVIGGFVIAVIVIVQGLWHQST